MSMFALIVSQVLALALGAGITAQLIRRSAGSVAAIGGYGYVLGLVAMTLVLRALSFIGIAWSFWLPASIAVGLSIVAFALARTRWRDAPLVVANDLAAWQRWLVVLLWALICVHVGFALVEALLRPLFPWDAAAQWATKARVWFQYRRIVPFVDDMTWIGLTGDVFTDAHPTYPGTVPLFQVWAALAWGSFDDATINLGWPLFLAASAFGIYGGLRRLAFAPLPAVAVAYVVTSLPFVDVHAALAGYADLAVAVVYAFAWLAFAAWTRERTVRNAALTLLCAFCLPLLKTPGWVWLGTLMPGIAALYLSPRILRWLAAAGAVVALAVVLYATYVRPVTIIGYQVAPQQARVIDALASNFFLFANWHLLGLLLPFALLVARRALFVPMMLPITVVAGTAVAALMIVFFFTSASVEGVGAYTTVNRAALHVVPALVIYVAILWHEYWQMRTSAVDGTAIAAA
ncbi:MAG TPA: hypothetical protein VGK44_07950 [Casimicrobiaceae bacterium]